MYVYTCIYVCGRVYTYVICVGINCPPSLCMVVWYNVTDQFGEIRTYYRRFRFVLIMNPIWWRFKNRPMRCSVDQYQFMQWRPDDDSVLKSRHFMWVFTLVSFSYLSLSVLSIYYLYHFMWPLDIFYQFDYSDHFIWCQWVFTLIIQLI